MLDLKGHDPRLPRRLARVVEAAGAGELTVCSRSWALLEPLRELAPSLRLVASVGSRRQLRRLDRRFAGRRLAGVSIHRDLLSPGVVERLRERADVVLSWPVETPADARRLAGWGVHGLISKDFAALGTALA
jgi:glycerophosphoryl diester phosphodiesterase